jgi:SAM-dependent methyltransferase
LTSDSPDTLPTRTLPPIETATHYDREFYELHRSGSLSSARTIVPMVIDLVRPRSVVDLGCGVGTWLKAFAEVGISDYWGFDGDYVSRDQLLIEPSRFRPADLKNPPALGRTFDLAVCLEVGEHLPAKSAPKLVKTLTEAAPCVLFSAAFPGQGGTHHVNEQWPQFWRRLFAARGYDRLDPIRPRVWRERSVEWWYKQNVYLYCDRSYLATANAALREEAELAATCPFELLYAGVFDPLTTVRGLAQHLVKAAPRAIGRILRPNG